MQSTQPLLHPFNAGQDELGYASALRHAFNTDLEGCRQWWELAGHDHVRAVRSGRRTVGGLVLIPMKQNFLGRTLSCCGIAGVAIGPESKGQGLASKMMAESLAEQHAAGFAVSALYPSTAALYRSVGYEFAGTRLRWTVRFADFPRPTSATEVRPMRDGDLEFVESCAKERAATEHGHMERGTYLWRRALEPKGQRASGWIFGSHANPEGYAVLHTPKAHEGDFETLELADWGARTPAAFEGLAGLLAGYGTVWKKLSWYGSPGDPLFLRLREHRFEAEVSESWMLRLVDAPKALAARGYPAGLHADLELQIEDPILSQNSGNFLLRVVGGRAKLEPGGAGKLRASIGGLSALFSGYASAEHLALLGQVSGDAETLRRATGMFASPPPNLLEFF